MKRLILRALFFSDPTLAARHPPKDVDIMVVESDLRDRLQEMVRLNRLLDSVNFLVDLLVVSKEKFDYWSDTPGNVYFEAAVPCNLRCNNSEPPVCDSIKPNFSSLEGM